MTLQRKLELGFGCLLVVGLVVAVVTYVKEREDRLRAELTVQLKQKDIDTRDQQTSKAIADLKAQLAQVKTPAQAVQALPTVITLPQPAKQLTEDDIKRILAGAAGAGQGASSAGRPPLPDAPTPQNEDWQPRSGDLVIPEASIRPLYEKLNQCEQADTLLEGCKADLKDTQQQRDAALKGMRGGSFFTRLKRNASWLGLGAAGGVVIGLAAHR